MFEAETAGADGLDADPAGDLGAGIVGTAQKATEAAEKRLDVRTEQAAAVQVGEQVLHRQEGVDFFRAEPQARQFELGTEIVVVGFEAVAALIAVEDHRGAEGVAQVADIAGQRGAGDTQIVLQVVGGDGVPVAEQAAELVKAVGGDQVAA